MRLLLLFTLLPTCFLAIGQGIDTEYKYDLAKGKEIVIQNSLPRGGLLKRNLDGEELGFVIFYNRIINETTDSMELTISFPADSIPLPSNTNTYFNFFLPPPDIMELKEEISFDHDSDEGPAGHGLDILSYLEKNQNQPTMLQRTINPKDSCLFFVLIASTFRTDDVGRQEFYARAGFSLEGQDLFYSINTVDIKFECGQLVFKD